MESLLAVLLYLQLIISPGEYLESEIYSIESLNQADVTEVENDISLCEWVRVEYADEVTSISIIDNLEE